MAGVLKEISQDVLTSPTLIRNNKATQTTASNNTQYQSAGHKFHMLAKKKIEKIKNKFTEFFLSSSKSTSSKSSSTPSSVSISSSSDNISQSMNSSVVFESSERIDQTSNNSYRKVTVTNPLSFIPHKQILFKNFDSLEKFDNQYQLNSDGKLNLNDSPSFTHNYFYF